MLIASGQIDLPMRQQFRREIEIGRCHTAMRAGAVVGRKALIALCAAIAVRAILAGIDGIGLVAIFPAQRDVER
jgi:hypothetical protein